MTDVVRGVVRSVVRSPVSAIGGFRSDSAYNPVGSAYDGSTTYALRGADLTGIADGKEFTFVARLNFNDDTVDDDVILSNDPAVFGAQFNIYRGPQQQLVVVADNAAGTDILIAASAFDVFEAADGEQLVSISCDLATGRFQMYLGDTDISPTPSPITNDLIDFTTGEWVVGARTGGGAKLNACLANLIFHNVSIDLDDLATRRTIVDASGNPVDPGDGTPIFGEQALIVSPSGDLENDQQGSGGAFTNQADLDPCSG